MKNILLLFFVCFFSYTQAQSSYNKNTNLMLGKSYNKWFKVHPDKKGEALILKPSRENLDLFLDEVVRVLDHYEASVDSSEIINFDMPEYVNNLGNKIAINRALKEDNNHYAIKIMWFLTEDETMVMNIDKTAFSIIIF